MGLSFEGFTKVFPDCPVISGFGSPAVWVRLPNNKSVRCLAIDDIRYGKVTVAITADNRYIAISPFRGRELMQRMEQFLKVRSGLDDGAIAEHIFFPMATILYNQVRAIGFYNEIAYGTQISIWAKIDTNLPIEIDTLTYDGGDLVYGNAIALNGSYFGMARNVWQPESASIRAATRKIWHQHITASLVLIHFTVTLVRETDTSGGTVDFIATLVYDIDAPQGTNVRYRAIAFAGYKPSLGGYVAAPDDVVSDVLYPYTGADGIYENYLYPQVSVESSSSTSGTPSAIAINPYSLPGDGVSYVQQRTTLATSTEIDNDIYTYTGFDVPVVSRPPFAVPVEFATNLEYLTYFNLFDPTQTQRSPFAVGYTGIDFLHVSATPIGDDPDNDIVYAPTMPEGGRNVQYAYENKAWWGEIDKKPLMTLTDEQHTEFLSSEDFDPFVLPLGYTDVLIDFAPDYSVVSLSPRGAIVVTDTNTDTFAGDTLFRDNVLFGAPFFPVFAANLNEDYHLMYFLIGDRTFHIYTRDANDEPPTKIDEFSFGLNYDDFTTLGITDNCYLSSMAHADVDTLGSPLINYYADGKNFPIDLTTAFVDPDASMLSLCAGCISWRLSPTPIRTKDNGYDEGGTLEKYYAYGEILFGTFPSKMTGNP